MSPKPTSRPKSAQAVAQQTPPAKEQSRWRRRDALRLAALSPMGITALACRGERPELRPGTMVIFQEQRSAWVRNFNPLTPPGSHRWVTRAAMYEPMMIYNVVTGEYAPWLATEYQWSADHLGLSFSLRAGLKWSDGTALSTEDVVETFQLTRKFPALDEYGMWRYLASVEASGPDTIHFRFKRPFTPGLFYLAKQPIVPHRLWRDIKDPVMYANPNPVGTGPYTEVTVFQNQVIQVERNPHYWQPVENAVQALRFPSFVSNEQSNLALLSGELDWAGNFVPAIDRIFVGTDPKHHKYWFPLVQGSVFLYSNTTRAPFNDTRVRKALSMGIDRDLVVRIAMHSYTRPSDATGMSDAYKKYRSADAVAAGDWVRHDLDAANKMLDEAGLLRGTNGIRRLKDGSPMRYDLNVVSGWSDYATSAQIIARNLTEVGVEVSVRSYDFNAWHQRLGAGEFDLSLGWSVEASPTPYTLYRALMSDHTRKPVGEHAPENWHRFADPRADELLAALEESTDPERIRSLTNELQMLFVQHAPAIPIFPMPSWGECNTTRVTGFPSAADPYAKLTPHAVPETLLVLSRLRAR